MTPDELDAIRDRHRNLKDYGPINAAVDDVGALLVEVDRLRREQDEWLTRFGGKDAWERERARLSAVRDVYTTWNHDPDAYHVGVVHASILADLRAALGED